MSKTYFAEKNLLNELKNLVRKYITGESFLYNIIDSDNAPSQLATGLNANDGYTVVSAVPARSICVNIRPNTQYTIESSIGLSNKRFGLFSTLPNIGDVPNTAYSMMSTQKTLHINSGENDNYLFIELWSNGDVLTNTDSLIKDIKVYETIDSDARFDPIINQINSVASSVGASIASMRTDVASINDRISNIDPDAGIQDWDGRPESLGFKRRVPLTLVLGEYNQTTGVLQQRSGNDRVSSQIIPRVNDTVTIHNTSGGTVKLSLWGWDANMKKVSGAIDNTAWVRDEWTTFKILKDEVAFVSLHIGRYPDASCAASDVREYMSQNLTYYDGEFKIGRGLCSGEVIYGRLQSPYSFYIDTTKKTMRCGGSYIVAYGGTYVSNPPFDISNFNGSALGTFYYDIPNNVITWRRKTELKNIDCSNYVILGDSWSNVNAIQLNTIATVYVNNVRVNNDAYDNRFFSNTSLPWLFEGDSICWGRTFSGVDAATPFPAVVAGILGMRIYEIKAVPGACVATTSANTATDISERAATYDYSKYRGVVMNGGTNDYGYHIPLGTINDTSPSTFYGAWNSIMTKIFTDNPTIKVLLITPIFRNYVNNSPIVYGDAYDIKNKANASLNDYCDAIVAIGKKYKVPVFDSRKNCPVNPVNYATTLADDNTGKFLHPTQETYIEYGNRIAAFMKQCF